MPPPWHSKHFFNGQLGLPGPAPESRPELVDLLRQDEVVVVQTVDGMSPQDELDPVPAGDVNVGMVLFFLGEHPDAVHPGQRLAKVLGPKAAADAAPSRTS